MLNTLASGQFWEFLR